MQGVLRRVRDRYAGEPVDDADHTALEIEMAQPWRTCSGSAMMPISAREDSWRKKYAQRASWRAVYAARAHEALANFLDAMERADEPLPAAIEIHVDRRPLENRRSSETLPDVIVFTAQPCYATSTETADERLGISPE